MKKLIFTTVCLAALTANAQINRSQFYPENPLVSKHIQSLLNKGISNTGVSKTTGTGQRVTSQSYYTTSYYTIPMYIQDSTDFFYQGNKRSFYHLNNFVRFNTDDTDPWDIEFSGRISYATWDTDAGPLAINSSDSASYNNIGKPDTVYTMKSNYSSLFTILKKHHRTEYAYNTQGQRTEIHTDLWDTVSNSYIPNQVERFNYNNAGLIVSDSTSYLDSSNYKIAIIYTYDNLNREKTYSGYYNSAPGNAFGLSWTYNITYYGNTNNVKTTQLSYLYSGSVIDSFAYNSAGLISYTSYSVLNQQTNIFEKQLDYVRSFNNAGLPDTILVNHAPGWIANAPWLTEKMVYFFNNYNNPDSIVYYPVINGITSFIPSSKFTFRYETYNDLAVADAKKDNTILLFPNPSYNAVSIRRDYNFSNRETATIWNTAGQKLIEQGLGNNKTANITINQLTPGVYWLLVHDDTGAILSRQSFVKK